MTATSLGSQSPPPALSEKYAHLRDLLRAMGSVVIGYSGGVDSTLLLKVATDELGANAVAVIGDSEAFPQGEVESALAVAEAMGATVVRVPTHELADPRFRVNNPDRCYFCKTELFSVLRQVARERGIPHIADGTHADDAGDHRPGMRAAEELAVRSPLREVGLTKAEVRSLAQHLGLSNWDKPSFACLSSRFPYGTTITPELLARVDGCEKVLRRLGFRQFRVRHHDTVARIELMPEDFPIALKHRETLVQEFRAFGYLYVTLDLEGFRSGKMNDALSAGGASQRTRDEKLLRVLQGSGRGD